MTTHATPTRRRHRPTSIRGLPVEEVLDDFRTACTSRALDDAEIRLQKQSRVHFQISGAGHEALGLGLARYLRPGHDWFFPYYRDLALCLGLGVTAAEVLLQAVGSSADPSSAGRQMPSHWGNDRLNIVTQSSPTASQCIPAVGCAEAGRYIVRRPDLPGCRAHGDELTYVSLGEGACSEGEFWESLNTACTLHLPVLYVVADNGFAISVPASDQAPAPVAELVRGFRGLKVARFDGTDYFTVRKRARSIIEHVRAGVGPALIHADVVRPYSHSAADTQSKYRLATELAEEATHDPITVLEAALIGAGALSPSEAHDIREQAIADVARASAEALAAPRPDPARILDQVTALPEMPVPGDPAGTKPRTRPGTKAATTAATTAERPDDATDDGSTDDTTDDGSTDDGSTDDGSTDDGVTDDGVTDDEVLFGEAIRRTLHEQLAADERIRVFGEDVADAREAVLADLEGKGGVFGTTHGLQRTFGQARCYNAPLSEANIVGRAVGQALRGLRPCPEIQFFDYIWPAMTQIRSEAATIRWRSNGRFTCPMVLRVPIGGYLTGGSIWHSQSGESTFAHVPGLLIAFPSRAVDAVGLLRYAFRCEDPVLYLEHKHLLRQPYTAGPFPGPDHVLPFGHGTVRRPGDDVTIVTWGATVEKSLQAATRAAEVDGIEAEVIDLRTIAPWDRELVADSVAATSRLLVVHEDVLTGGFGGEVAAWAGEHCFADLDAPVRRLAALDCHVPYEPTLEAVVLPQTDDIYAALVDLATF